MAEAARIYLGDVIDEMPAAARWALALWLMECSGDLPEAANRSLLQDDVRLLDNGRIFVWREYVMWAFEFPKTDITNVQLARQTEGGEPMGENLPAVEHLTTTGLSNAASDLLEVLEDLPEWARDELDRIVDEE